VAETPTIETRPSPWLTGLTGRCPACGQGRLFDGFLTVAPACEACGQDQAAQDSGDGPAAFIVLIVGCIVVGAALVVEVKYSPPVWVHLVIWLPLAMVLVLALLRPGKGLLIALQMKHRRHDFDLPA
jgi:uncharacterized protein (DUF983 family)